MIITLCGSARFEALFKAWNEALTICGHTVFSLTAYPSDKGRKDWYSEDVKRALDAAHFRKIDASGAILVINRFAYIGESTKREIEHARALALPVYFTESWSAGNGICSMHMDEVRDLCESFGLGRSNFSPIDTTTRTPGTRCPYDLMGPAGTTRSAAVQLIAAAKQVRGPSAAPTQIDYVDADESAKGMRPAWCADAFGDY